MSSQSVVIVWAAVRDLEPAEAITSILPPMRNDLAERMAIELRSLTGVTVTVHRLSPTSLRPKEQ